MYFWLKILHVSAMVLWFAGLFLLPRLFAARHRGGREAAQDYFNPVANTLFFRLVTPAALVAIASGMILIAYGPTGAWLVIKLVLVTAAVLLHLYLGVVLYNLGQGMDRHGPAFYRVLGWTPLAIVLAIAALTGAKPATVGELPPPPGHATDR
ncbi:CopD family protein [Luteimonas terricola]|uniref:Protoporphyrinogen IX oxidase n=1 Tax=Luteimonas terricola TaxID=645597 RepID=A0ABQ2EJE8_9GAMM|nr:CopD family protein [Luteimonas terricola]GGK13616.1 TIGR00701 family protein [Luteimonas terricola]